MRDLSQKQKRGWVRYMRQCTGAYGSALLPCRGWSAVDGKASHVLCRLLHAHHQQLSSQGVSDTLTTCFAACLQPMNPADTGLAADSPPPPDAVRPRVTIVNRAHRAGRSIVTAPEALERIQASAAFSGAQLVYMEQRSLHEQVHCRYRKPRAAVPLPTCCCDAMCAACSGSRDI